MYTAGINTVRASLTYRERKNAGLNNCSSGLNAQCLLILFVLPA